MHKEAKCARLRGTGRKRRVAHLDVVLGARHLAEHLQPALRLAEAPRDVRGDDLDSHLVRAVVVKRGE